MAELVCQTHGPYDSSYGTCPYCSGQANRPPAPDPLEDDMPTDLGGGPHQGASWDDENAPTELGADYQGQAGGLSFDDLDPTEIGRSSRDDVTELDFVDTSAIGIFWVKEGSRRGQIHRIKDGTTIGRSRGDIIMDDPKVSNPHAKLTLENEQFVIWDFGSKNGTSVNGERIRAATELSENDVVKIGDTVMVLKLLQ